MDQVDFVWVFNGARASFPSGIFRPNREGTPFGKAGYGLPHMVGDWYCFSASNDY